jgi:predicted glycogen debranching enzyme
MKRQTANRLPAGGQKVQALDGWQATIRQSSAADAAGLRLIEPIGRDVLSDPEAATRREWLVTNGIGGFAAGTVAGMNTRRYHGLLIAALRPPVERVAMVAKLDVVASYRGRRFDLATNEFADGTVSPRGCLQLESFHLEGNIPVWTWLLGDALLEQRIWMPHGANTTYVSFTALRADAAVDLQLTPLCTYRDYHSQHCGDRNTSVDAIAGGVAVESYPGARRFRILLPSGRCAVAPDWYWSFKHRAESERGLDDVEDLFRPALFDVTLEPGATTAIVFTAEDGESMPADASLQRELARQRALLADAGIAATHSSPLSQLVLAADQFIVARGERDRTVIAGYPWFGDWGRDTMIALPGLTLTTRRYQAAAGILRTFAKFVSEGMLPNRFPDAGEAPEYNTVDATLWYFVAIDEYFRCTGDRALLEALYPTLASIVDWHRRGTRYGIRVDDNDGLLCAGEAGVQLTWMDAKVGDWVVTPRIGKPVEVNALWFNALAIMRDFASLLSDSAGARDYGDAAQRVARGFNERFWFERGGYLYDVVDSPQGNDASLRPNQILAVSLRHPLLDDERARAVVDVCAGELWTPVGLRSLGKADPRYAARYTGGPRERDAVYHQGTVWSWLLGPFALAHYRAYGDAGRARSYLTGITAHLREACVGQVSEIFDGDAPFTPRGCFAQAWSVAETLRVWSEIDAS